MPAEKTLIQVVEEWATSIHQALLDLISSKGTDFGDVIANDFKARATESVVMKIRFPGAEPVRFKVVSVTADSVVGFRAKNQSEEFSDKPETINPDQIASYVVE